MVKRDHEIEEDLFKEGRKEEAKATGHLAIEGGVTNWWQMGRREGRGI